MFAPVKQNKQTKQNKTKRKQNKINLLKQTCTLHALSLSQKVLLSAVTALRFVRAAVAY